jgi:acetyl esterase
MNCLTATAARCILVLALLSCLFPDQRHQATAKVKDHTNSTSSGNAERLMREPDVFIIGMERAATASLYSLFSENPAFCTAGVPKSIGFFNNDHNWEKGYHHYYRKRFASCTDPTQLLVDATAVFDVSEVPERIGSLYPVDQLQGDKKFILIVREYVSREYSLYRSRVLACYESLGVEGGRGRRRLETATVTRPSVKLSKACATVLLMPSSQRTAGAGANETSASHATTSSTTTSSNSSSSSTNIQMNDATTRTFKSFREYYLSGGVKHSNVHYSYNLQKWLRVIRRSQLFILDIETLLKNTEHCLVKLQGFLGLTSKGWTSNAGAEILLPHLGASSRVDAPLDCAIVEEMASEFKKSNKGLYELIRGADDKYSGEPYFADLRHMRSDPSCVETRISAAEGVEDVDVWDDSVTISEETVTSAGSASSSHDTEYPPLASMVGTEPIVFRESGDIRLYLYVLKPDSWNATARIPAMVCFFPGGWRTGSPHIMLTYIQWAAAHGMVGVAPDYRAALRFGTEPEDAVDDARAAMQWVQTHADELGIDVHRIISVGSSAGGHLAAWQTIPDTLSWTPMIKEFERSKPAPYTPAALILVSPVLDTTDTGFGGPENFGDSRARSDAMSVLLHMPRIMPPTVVMHGSADTTVPIDNSKEFVRLMKANGNQCELVIVSNASHSILGFPGGKTIIQATIAKFVATLGWSDVIV